MTYDDIAKVNAQIITTDIKGKKYADVNQRIKAFRMLYPEGSIITEMLSCADGVCVFKATVMNSEGCVLGTGTALSSRARAAVLRSRAPCPRCTPSKKPRAMTVLSGLPVPIVAFALSVQSVICRPLSSDRRMR